MKLQKFLYGTHPQFNIQNSTIINIQPVLRKFKILVSHSELDSESSSVSFHNYFKDENEKVFCLVSIAICM